MLSIVPKGHDVLVGDCYGVAVLLFKGFTPILGAARLLHIQVIAGSMRHWHVKKIPVLMY